MASRKPNSRVRALTENASTPATPTKHGKRGSRKHSEYHGIEAIRSENFRAYVFERSGTLYRLVDRHATMSWVTGVTRAIRICAGVDEEAAAKHGTFFHGM